MEVRHAVEKLETMSLDGDAKNGPKSELVIPILETAFAMSAETKFILSNTHSKNRKRKPFSLIFTMLCLKTFLKRSSQGAVSFTTLYVWQARKKKSHDIKATVKHPKRLFSLSSDFI